MKTNAQYYSIDGNILPQLTDVANYIGVSDVYVRKQVFRKGGKKSITSFVVRDITVNVHTTTYINKNKKA